jgi:hypothetical protein
VNSAEVEESKQAGENDAAQETEFRDAAGSSSAPAQRRDIDPSGTRLVDSMIAHHADHLQA